MITDVQALIESIPLLHKYAHYLSHPLISERLNLAITNGIVILCGLVFCLVISYFLSDHIRELFFTWFFKALIFLPFLTRAVVGYAYDTPFALICLLVDLATLIFVWSKIGKMLFRAKSISVNLVGGVASATLIALILNTLNINALFGKPGIVIHLLITIWFFYSFDAHTYLTKTIIHKKLIITILILFIPFAPYVFAPSAPDNDTAQHTEFLGYALQGHHFSDIKTGVANEWVFIRYPGGMSSLGWITAHMQNIFSSECLLLYWYLSYLFIILGIRQIAKKIYINEYIAIILVLNPTIFWAIKAGLQAKMLSYAFCLFMVSSLIDKKVFRATVFIVAGTVIVPLVVLPFWPLYVVIGAGLILRGNVARRACLFSFVLLGLLGIYTAVLSFGEKLSSPKYFITNKLLIDHPNFTFENLWSAINISSVGLPYLFLAIIIFIFAKSKADLVTKLIIFIWFLSACLFYLFWPARILRAMALNGPWIISTCMLYTWVTNQKFFQKHWFKHAFNAVFILMIVSLIIPTFRQILNPATSVTSHSDIRMGRFVSQALPNNALIANIRPPEDMIKWGEDNLLGYAAPSFRGDSLKNTVFSNTGRIHHDVKNGLLIDRRPYIDCICKESTLMCFKSLGVTHVFISKRPGTKSFVTKTDQRPYKSINGSYLYKL